MPAGISANLAYLIEQKFEREGISDSFEQRTKEVNNNNQTINITININSGDDVDKVMDSLLSKLPNVGKVELRETKDWFTYK